MEKQQLNSSDYFKSIEQLEHDFWGVPEQGSYLIMTCCKLRKKPLIEFTIDDLRIMIGQNIGLPYLIPIAIKKLQENILAEGDFYPGDLINSVLTVEEAYWKNNKENWKTIRDLFQENIALFSEDKFYRDLIKRYEKFEKML